MQSAVVIGIVLIAGLLVLRSLVRKARDKESCGCASCDMAGQCRVKDDSSCDEP